MAAAHQYVYHMHKLSKTYPGGKTVLKDISLSFLPGAKIGVTPDPLLARLESGTP